MGEAEGRTPSPYTLHYTSEDLTGGTWSVYSEQYENEAAVDKAAGPMESLTVLVSTHPTRREADAEANRLQRQTTPARTPSDRDSSRRCGYCQEAVADVGYDRCTDCRTWRDEDWCEANHHEHGVPIRESC